MYCCTDTWSVHLLFVEFMTHDLNIFAKLHEAFILLHVYYYIVSRDVVMILLCSIAYVNHFSTLCNLGS